MGRVGCRRGISRERVCALISTSTGGIPGLDGVTDGGLDVLAAFDSGSA